MTGKPHVWHFGLVAQTWAEFSVDTPELPYYKKKIEQFGQPVLDLACGTGRLLLPLLRAGIDMDGCDISADMLDLCREKAAREGLNPRLYQQAMHEFKLPRTYKMIYMCGSFGLAGSRQLDLDTLRRCYQHLDPGGALIVNIEAEYASREAWEMWLEEERQALPEPWPKEGRRRQAADGSEYLTWIRTLAVDPLEQSFMRQIRVEKWQAESLVAEEAYTLRGNMYFRNEMLLMLELAGFQDMVVQGDYTEEAATAEHSELLFIGRKQE